MPKSAGAHWHGWTCINHDKAAELISKVYRFKINAATMLDRVRISFRQR